MAPRKYAHLNLPAFTQETTFQQRVDEAAKRLELAGMPPGQLGSLYDELDAQLDTLEEQRKILSCQRTAVEQELLRAFEEDEITSVRLGSGTLIYTQEEPYAQVKDNVKLGRFVAQEKIEGLLRLPWQTLNSIVKERLLTAKPVPEGVEVFMKTSVRKRRG